MDHDPASIAQAALVLNAALMKHLVAKGVIAEDLKPIFENAAGSVQGNPDVAAILAVLNDMIKKPGGS